MTAEYGDRVVGYFIYFLNPSWIYLSRIAVHPDYRRFGAGRQMIDKIKSKLACDRRNRIDVEVRETLLESQLFLRSMGFKAIQVLREYYEDTGEDAYAMSYHL